MTPWFELKKPLNSRNKPMVRVITFVIATQYDRLDLRTRGAPDGAPQAHRLAHPDRVEPRTSGAPGRAPWAHQDVSPRSIQALSGRLPGNVEPAQTAAPSPREQGRTRDVVRPHHSRNESRKSVATQNRFREYARAPISPHGAPRAHPTAHRGGPEGRSSDRPHHLTRTRPSRLSLKLRMPCRPRVGIIRSLSTALVRSPLRSELAGAHG